MRSKTGLFTVLALGMLFAVSVMAAPGQPADASIRFNQNTKVFRIDAGKVTYAFGINADGMLQTVYWGGRLAKSDPLGPAVPSRARSSWEPAGSYTSQEYGAWGGNTSITPALKVHFADGNRDLVLRYQGHRIGDDSLRVTLADKRADVKVVLHYSVDPATGIIGRSARIENDSDQSMTIDRAAAATWNLPSAHDYSLRYLTGKWASEWHLQTRPVTQGTTVLQSRHGSTGNRNNPWFAIEQGGDWDESYGRLWFGALGWSGSWRISIDQDVFGQVHVTGGFNPFDFSWPLKPGQSLITPIFYAGYTAGGIGEASRLMHRFQITRILPGHPDPKLRPVLYNSWEATGFDVSAANQMKLAEVAAKLGIERFVMDDGWFGERDDDTAGLGDWYANPEKFPHGLEPLIDKVHSLGMSFGLWVEPEMVNPDSHLYRKHPDWVLHFKGRPRSEARHQLVLNLARKDVSEYVFNALDRLLSKYDIQFLKWDYNRYWTEPGWPAAAPADEQKVYVKYVRNLYDIIRRLRKRHPGLEIESCSSGGARVDLGIMRMTDEVWPSDNTDPSDRLSIQYGFTYAYAPAVMMSWVTGSPNWVNHRDTSLDFRFLVSMQGGLGIGANIVDWTPRQIAKAKRYIKAYKAIRPTVQRGRLFRLISPLHRAPMAATESVSRDGSQAMLFAYLRTAQEAEPYPTLHLKGLEPDARYSWHTIHGKVADGTPKVASGAYWMRHGINLQLRHDMSAAAIVFDRATAAAVH